MSSISDRKQGLTGVGVRLGHYAKVVAELKSRIRFAENKLINYPNDRDLEESLKSLNEQLDLVHEFDEVALRRYTFVYSGVSVTHDMDVDAIKYM